MFLAHQEIRRLALDPSIRLIDPYTEQSQAAGVSFGCGPASYDLRLDRDVMLWPGRSVRADAVERVHIPPYIGGLLLSKSTWAREHIEQAGTMIDPGFGWGHRGILRLEINMHHGNRPIAIKAGTGICQVIFAPVVAIMPDGTIRVVDTDRPYTGKYQDQGPDQDAIFKIVV